MNHLHMSKRVVGFGDYQKNFGIGNRIGNLLDHPIYPSNHSFLVLVMRAPYIPQITVFLVLVMRIGNLLDIATVNGVKAVAARL